MNYFLKAADWEEINAHLDEDTPRLVFADWLQENGDEPRAEFIRLQCAAARGDPSGAKRADKLLTEHRQPWLRGLPLRRDILFPIPSIRHTSVPCHPPAGRAPRDRGERAWLWLRPSLILYPSGRGGFPDPPRPDG